MQIYLVFCLFILGAQVFLGVNPVVFILACLALILVPAIAFLLVVVAMSATEALVEEEKERRKIERIEERIKKFWYGEE